MKSVVVNLLPSRQSWYLRQQRAWQVLQQISLAVGVVYVLLLVGFFSWKMIMNGQTRALQGQIDEAKQQLGNLTVRESQQALVKSKLNRLTQILKGRVDFSGWLGRLMSLLPAEVILGDVKVGAVKKVEISGTTTSVLALAEFIDRIQDPEVGGAVFDQVTAQSVSKSTTGEYVFTLTLVPKVGGK